MRGLAHTLISLCSVRRPRAGAWRGTVNLVAHEAGGDLGADHRALIACGRRGRWRTALDLLAKLEATPTGATAGAYRSALLACRKQK